MPDEKPIGRVSHYYNNIGVAILDLSDNLQVGQTVHFKGVHDDYTQTVDQMEIDHQSVVTAAPGDSVGIRVVQKIHENDQVLALV
jgi:hypothetical protein